MFKQFHRKRTFISSHTEHWGVVGETTNHETVRNATTVTDKREWTSVPNWKALIQRGQDATTPFYGELYTVETISPMKMVAVTPEPGNRAHRCEISGDNPQVSPADFGNFSNFDVTSADNQALTAFWKKLRKEQVTMSGQVFLGEVREAARMIKSPASALFNAHSGYLSKAQNLRRKTGNGKTFKSAVADLWLEANFGWKPFISDIEDGWKAYQEVFKVRDQKKLRSIGSSEVVETLYHNLRKQIGHNGPVLLVSIIEQKICTVIYRAGLKDDRDLSHLGSNLTDRTLKRFGLTLEEFIPTAWELTPWSFLIDYFTNVGDIVEAMATSTSSIGWLNKTVIKENIRNYEVHNDLQAFHSSNFYGPRSPRCYCFGEPGSARYRSKQVTRSSLSTLPYPSFQVSMPTSPTKWANMLALLYSQERSQRKAFFR